MFTFVIIISTDYVLYQGMADNIFGIKIIKTNKEFLFCIYLSAIKKVYLNQQLLGEEFGNNVSVKQKHIHQPDHHRDFNQGSISGV